MIGHKDSFCKVKLNNILNLKRLFNWHGLCNNKITKAVIGVGSVTEKIADYFTRYLVPMCDFALDIHSGGKTLDIVPFAAAHRLDNLDQEEACILGAKLFGAPYTMILLEMDATSLYDTAVESQGKIFVTTELRGTSA